MTDALEVCSDLAFGLAVGFFFLAVFFWFRFQIRKTAGDLSGRNARKSIDRIRERNRLSGEKQFRSSPFNLERGKLTETIAAKKQELYGAERQHRSEETEVLGEETVLLEPSGSADPVVQDPPGSITAEIGKNRHFIITKNIVLIHTRETAAQEGTVL